MKTISLFQNQIILSKRISFLKKIFHPKNLHKFGEEDAAIERRDIYYRDILEAQMSSQSIEDQKLHI